MLNLKRFLMVFLALVILISGTGLMAQPAQAAGCTRYHYVRAGETLSWIGRYYGINWTYLAKINGLSWPYKIYVGQRLCISTTGTWQPPYPGTGARLDWDYKVTNVVMDTSVTIRTYNMPDNVFFEVFIGRLGSNGLYEWQKVADLDSDRGGTFNADFNIPATYAGTSRLFVRLVQAKKGTTVDRWFNNSTSTSGGTGGYPGYPWYPWYYGGIPTIWIVSVVRDNEVTIRTNNFPAGLVFDVYMGPMGTRGVGGYHVGTLNSGAGGTLVVTFKIPAPLYGSRQISIRTQNWATGYYSYNWFYNNTAVDP